MQQHHPINLRVPRASVIALLETADSIVITPSPEQSASIVEGATNIAAGAARARYEKLDENGNALPLSTRDYAALVDYEAGLIVDVRALHKGDHESCTHYAAESNFLGRKWALPSVDFLFAHVVDRRFQSPAINPELYPTRIGNQLIWSSTPDAAPEDPARPVCAWFVYSGNGDANIASRYNAGLALPVSPLASPSSQ